MKQPDTRQSFVVTEKETDMSQYHQEESQALPQNTLDFVEDEDCLSSSDGQAMCDSQN